MEEKKKKMPTWGIVLIVILVIALFGSASNNSDNANSKSDKSAATTTTVKKKLELEEGYTAGLDDTGYFYYVEGYINNPTDKNYSYVQVTFTSYDSNGNTLGTCLDNNSGLESGGRWKFKASCLESASEIASVKLKEIKAY